MQQFQNVTIEVKGKQVVITITDYTRELGMSGSGKSMIVATTGGNQSVPGTDVKGKDLMIGLNAYRKA
jgi:hypothetical protein